MASLKFCEHVHLVGLKMMPPSFVAKVTVGLYAVSMATDRQAQRSDVQPDAAAR